MSIVFLPPSEKELDEAFEYYECQMEGLGKQFVQEFNQSIKLISNMPYAWRKVGLDTHRINIKKFPYLIFYQVEYENILVACVAHQHRDPRYYSQRIR